jgi:integrase
MSSAAWNEYLHQLAEREKSEDAAGAQAAAGARSDSELIGDFYVWFDRAGTTFRKYARCVAEFSAYLHANGVPCLFFAKRRDVIRFLMWLNGGAEIKTLFDSSLTSEEQRPPRRPLSPSSRKGYLSALRAFYYYCLEMEYIEIDPTARIRSPKVPPPTKGLTLEAEQLRLFLDAHGSERDRVQAYLFVFTAARAGELRTLRWRDLDWHNREFIFRGKRGKTNIVPMHDELAGALRRWQVAQRRQAETNQLLANALAYDETAFVLLTRTGNQVTVGTLCKQVKWRAGRCGPLPHSPAEHVYHENKSHLHPHAIRRSWATLQRRRGVPLEDIADVLAHASTDTTRKHYAFPSDETKRRTLKSFSL